MAARWLRAAIALLLVIVVVGCGSGEPEPTTDPTTTASDPTTTPEPTDDETTPVETPTTSEPTTPDEAEPVGYVPWGPDDPVIPEHYGRLAGRDCDAAESVAPEGEFWDAVVAVCRSLNDGAPWPQLSEAPPAPDTENPHERCLDAELATMVSAALAWRAANPDAKPDVRYAETGSPCYTTIYEARQLSADEDGTAPDPGDVTVAVLVDSTYDLASVSVNGAEVDSDDYIDANNDPFIGARTVSIHVRAPETSTELTVELGLTQDGSDRGTVSASVEVTGAAGSGEGGSAGESATEDSSDEGATSDTAESDGS